jgi:hypothetical protein
MPEALHDAALETIQQCYHRTVRDASQPRPVYVISQAGGVWHDKQYREQLEDPMWYRRPGSNYETAQRKAVSEVLHAFLPPDHRARARWISEPEALVNIVRESLLEQVGYLLTEPTASYDKNSLDGHLSNVHRAARRLEGLTLLALSVGHNFPFSPILQSTEVYPAFDLSDGQHTNQVGEYAIARID